MKAIIFYILLFLFAIKIQAQIKHVTIDSYKLNEKREISFYVPEDYSKEKTYSLIVVLDADYLFDMVVGNAKFYNYNKEMPQCIIVGIKQSGTRKDDSYYSNVDNMPDKTGSAFFEFIGMELIPMIKEQYNIANLKTIIGHGITANFANYYLFKEKPLFNSYVVLSPEFAPEMENNIPKRVSELEQTTFYYLATGTNDQKENQKRIGTVNTQLKDSTYFYFDNFENADHYTVASYGIPKALDKIFKLYKPISVDEYKNEVLNYNGPLVDYLTKKYNDIEVLYGLKKKISVNDMMAIYAAAKKKENWETLHELSKIGKKEYPETMLSFFWEGEYYERKGEPKKAIRNYEKAFIMEKIDFLDKEFIIDRMDKLKADFK